MLYKRNSSKYYWCRFTAPNGKEVRKSTKTANKKEAEEFEVRFKAEYWRVLKLGDKPQRIWKEAVVKWLSETKHNATHDNQVSYIRYADKFLGDLKIDEINREVIDQIIDAKLKTGVTNATVNRITETIRAILNAAMKDWEWLEKVPKIRILPEPEKRIRFLTRLDSQHLLSELPPHTRAMAEFTLATGLRESNVTHLEWNQVNLQRKVAWVNADQAKGRKSIGVPLNSSAVRVLLTLRGNHSERVFTYQGRPINKANTKAWRCALKRAGIKDFRWHDLRHTWASWHIQNGTQLSVLKELGGWSDFRMVLKYAHLSPEHLASHAENICEKEVPGNNIARFPAHLTKQLGGS